jgi:hypothetical protein
VKTKHTTLVEVGYGQTNQLASLRSQHSTHLPEIYTQNLCGRVFIRRINSPDSGTCSDVEDALWVVRYGRFMQLPIEHLCHDFVMKVHPSLISNLRFSQWTRVSHTDLAQSKSGDV